jgi:hypothetical protein
MIPGSWLMSLSDPQHHQLRWLIQPQRQRLLGRLRLDSQSSRRVLRR